MNGAGDINSIGLLPDKLKTELALHVNLDTLKKVSSDIDYTILKFTNVKCVYVIIGDHFSRVST